MALATITITVVDGGLGILPPDTGNLQVTAGCCSKGTPGTLYALGSIGAVTTYLGYGPLAESVALKMASGAAVQYAYVLPQTNTGALSTVTNYGPGYGTMAVSAGPNETITVLCTTGGAFATAKFTYARSGFSAGLPQTSTTSPFAYLVPGTSTTVTITAAGGTQSFTAGDTWTISPTGVVTPGGSNVTTNTVTQSSQVFDQYEANVKFTATGTFATAQFAYTMGYRVDSSGVDISTYSAATIVPTGGKYAIPNTGIYLTFAQPIIVVTISTGGALGTMQFTYTVDGGSASSATVSNASASTTYAIAGTNTSIAFTAATYTLNDAWTVSALGAVTHSTGAGAGSVSQTSASFVSGDYNTFLSAPPSPSNSDITTAGTALISDTAHQWSIMQIANVPVTASAAATTEAIADAVATAGFAAYRFFRVVMECPTLNSIVISGGLPIYDTADTDSVVATAFASVQSAKGRTQVGAGDFDCISPITGIFQRRNAIWQEAARLNTTQFKDAPGKTANGSLSFIRALYRDEAQVPALDAARLVTLRTYQGIPGFYITAGPTMALTTSDFAQIPNCRIVDRGCQVTYAALFPFLWSDVNVDSTTGFILPTDKAKIEGQVTSQEEAALEATGQVSDVQFTINGTTNILSTGTMVTTVAIVPVAYFRAITVEIGFVNPAIAAAAA